MSVYVYKGFCRRPTNKAQFSALITSCNQAFPAHPSTWPAEPINFLPTQTFLRFHNSILFTSLSRFPEVSRGISKSWLYQRIFQCLRRWKVRYLEIFLKAQVNGYHPTRPATKQNPPPAFFSATTDPWFQISCGSRSHTSHLLTNLRYPSHRLVQIRFHATNNRKLGVCVCSSSTNASHEIRMAGPP